MATPSIIILSQGGNEEVPDFPRIDYANLDFLTIKQALLDFIESQFPDDKVDFVESNLSIMLLELWAWVGDLLAFTINMSANECFLATARQRQNVVNLVKLISYVPRPPSAASVELNIFTQTGGFPDDATIPAGTAITVNELTFELLTAFVIPAGTEAMGPGEALPGPTFSEGKSFSDDFTGDGAPFQTYILNNAPVIRDSIQVTVNAIIWNQVEALVFAGDTDSFSVSFDGDNRPTIRFGDGLTGRKPNNGDAIDVSYRVGGGKEGNIGVGLVNTQVTATSISGNVQVSLTNTVGGSGGDDEETIDSIKFNAPRFFRTHGNAITKEDYDTLASQFTDPALGSIAKAVAFPRFGQTNSSANEVDVFVWTKGPGDVFTTPAQALKESLLAFLNERKVIVVDIFINDGLIKDIDIDIVIFVSLNIRSAQDIVDEVEEKVRAFFNRDELTPSTTFFVSEIFEIVMAVQGVLQTNINEPGTPVQKTGDVVSSFVVGLTTNITGNNFLPAVPTLNEFANGTINFTSGNLSGQSFPIIKNDGVDQITIDGIIQPDPLSSFTLNAQLDCKKDVPVADNEIYRLGTLTIAAYARSSDSRNSVLVASL